MSNHISRRAATTTLTVAALLCAGCANEDATQPIPTTNPAPVTTTTAPAAGGDGSEGPATTTSPVAVDLSEVSVTLTEVAELELPTALVSRPGSTDLYAAERMGVVKVLQPTADGFDVEPSAVLDLTDDINDLSGERGLLGLAFSPNGTMLFVNYTDGSDDGASVVARYEMDGAVADPSTRREVLRLAQPYANHNGGNLAFGPDGYLYIGFGDGGSGDDPQDNGQDPTNWLGSMLRIDPLGPGTTDDQPYLVPADNPFVGSADALPELWAYGLRNPWRYSFDRATGDLWIADVGQNQWEEVDFLAAADGGGRGANLGWALREGTHDTEKSGTRPDGLVEPIFDYSHDDGASITGGYVYRGAAVPQLTGVYLFSDFAASTLRGLTVVDGRLDQQSEIATTGATPEQVVSFGEDADGEVYIVTLAGPILRIDPA